MRVWYPQPGWIHGLQADVVAFRKKLDYTSKVAAVVRTSFSKWCLHQADFISVYSESDTVMQEIPFSIALKKRLSVDIIRSSPCYYKSTISMCEPLQRSVCLKLGNFCQNENIPYAKIIFSYIFMYLLRSAHTRALVLATSPCNNSRERIQACELAIFGSKSSRRDHLFAGPCDLSR